MVHEHCGKTAQTMRRRTYRTQHCVCSSSHCLRCFATTKEADYMQYYIALHDNELCLVCPSFPFLFYFLEMTCGSLFLAVGKALSVLGIGGCVSVELGAWMFLCAVPSLFTPVRGICRLHNCSHDHVDFHHFLENGDKPRQVLCLGSHLLNSVINWGKQIVTGSRLAKSRCRRLIGSHPGLSFRVVVQIINRGLR